MDWGVIQRDAKYTEAIVAEQQLISFQSNIAQVNDLVNAYGDKLLWHMDTNTYLHVQVMEAESDVYECESVQNFYESASKIIKGF